MEPGNRLWVAYFNKIKLTEIYFSILRPNTLYAIITLQDAIISGGYYLSSHTLQDSLLGIVHTFVLPGLLTEGENPELSTFARRMVQYFHNALVLNDTSDRDHLPNFSTMDGVGDLFALFVIAMFLNALDERTYQLSSEISDCDDDTLLTYQKVFNLNAIPILERHQLCIVRGLAMDLVHWFSANYAIMDENSDEDEVDAFEDILVPFTVHVARQIIRYKSAAVSCGYKGIGTPEQIQAEIKSAMFHIPEMEIAYSAEIAHEQDLSYHSDSTDSESAPSELYDLNFDFSNFTVKGRQMPEEDRSHVEIFLDYGQNQADKLFSLAYLSVQFESNR
jgi:hypothetical protein